MTIARLLLARQRVVVLDEATAHLDNTSEAAVQEALTEALQGRTALVIAHRLSTVRAADQILVVEAGRIVERGTHDELLAAGGGTRSCTARSSAGGRTTGRGNGRPSTRPRDAVAGRGPAGSRPADGPGQPDGVSAAGPLRAGPSRRESAGTSSGSYFSHRGLWQGPAA